MTDAALKLSAHGDRETAFAAPRRLVFDFWTKPEILQKWLGVWGGWTMPTCEVELRAGGAYRYVWRGSGGAEMRVGGTYREVEPPERIVHTEAFDDPWYPGESVITTEFVDAEGGTIVTTTMRYESREARDSVLEHRIEGGVAASYDKLAELLKERRPGEDSNLQPPD